MQKPEHASIPGPLFESVTVLPAPAEHCKLVNLTDYDANLGTVVALIRRFEKHERDKYVGNGAGYVRDIYFTEHWWALVAQSRDDIMKQLRDSEQSARHEANAAWTAELQAKTALTELQKNYETALKERADATQGLVDAQSRNRDLNTRFVALEAELAAVKRHIGEAAYKAAIAAPKAG